MVTSSDLEIKKLVLAKKLFLHGCDHASGKDEISRMFAIHHFDNAVEFILKCSADKVNINLNDQKYRDFPPLCNEIFKKYNKLQNKRQILDQHTLRNQIQHSGTIPSTENILTFKVITQEFFKTACREIFHMNYDDLYLSQLIENTELKELAFKAEKAFNDGDFTNCITLCDEILEKTVFEHADILGKAGFLTGFWSFSNDLSEVFNENYSKKYENEPFYQPVKELSQAIFRLGMSSTGMQFLDEYKIDFLKFRDIVNKRDESEEMPLKDDVEFSLNFVINLLLKWQVQKIIN